MNDVLVSDDRKELTICWADGHRAMFRSSRPDGFTDSEIHHAHTCVEPTANMVEGQVNRAWRFPIGSRKFYLQVNTGPPTWWYPHVDIRRGTIMVGWFRALVAVSWK